jgi:hypothetical protein
MTAMTVKGRNVWNPVWLAPEIMRKKEYTEKADVYGYGTHAAHDATNDTTRHDTTPPHAHTLITEWALGGDVHQA